MEYLALFFDSGHSRNKIVRLPATKWRTVDGVTVTVKRRITRQWVNSPTPQKVGTCSSPKNCNMLSSP